MNRCAFVSAAVLVCALALSPVLTAQTAKPTPATSSGSTAPAAPAKFVPMVTGIASIEVIQSPPKRQGSDIVTSSRSRTCPPVRSASFASTSTGTTRTEAVTGDTETVKRILPGEIVEITMKSPASRISAQPVRIQPEQRQPQGQCEGGQEIHRGRYSEEVAVQSGFGPAPSVVRVLQCAHDRRSSAFPPASSASIPTHGG